MNNGEQDSLPQTPQQSSANTNTLHDAQNSGLLSGNPSQPRIVLPGQGAPTPTTHSDATMPLHISAMPAGSSSGAKSSRTVPIPKSEPIGASILDPTIPAAYPNSMQTPLSSPTGFNPTRVSRGVWWLITPVIAAVIIVILALLIIPVSAFWQPQNAVKTVLKGMPSSQPTPVAPSPVPTEVPTAIPTPTPANADTVATNGVSVTPGSFDVQNDCQQDNGYRCTLTLALASDAEDAISWTASLDGVDHSFHPRRGKLEPGQQEQIIVYLYDSCPIDAEFDIVMKHQHLNVPLQCS